MSIDFEGLKAKAKDLTTAGVAKAKEIAEISKLKMQNMTEQDAIRKAYQQMGKLYYEQHNAAPDAGYAELCQQVTESKGRITYNNERIADIQAAGNLSDEDIPADGGDNDPEI